MILPLYRRITEEDLGDAPKGAWKGKLLYALNLFMAQLYTGLSNNLTPEQNDIVQTKTFTLTGSSIASKNVYNFTTSYVYNPLGIDVLSIQPTDGSSRVFTTAPYVSWDYLNGTFFVLGISGLTDSVPYSITIRVWWPAVIN
jgi:hypothetical protein